MSRRGQSLIIVALAMVVLLGMAAAGVTYGEVAFTQTKLQNAVDAAALAGAQTAATGKAPTTNQSWLAQQNLGTTGSITVADSKSVASGVRATGTVTVPAGFAAVFGVKQFTVRATAVATYGPGQAFDYALFQGATTSPPLTIDGAITVNGAAHSNGSLTLNGAGCVTDGITTVTGTTISGVACPQTNPTLSGVVPMPIWTRAQVTPAGATTEVITSTVSGAFDINGPYIINAEGHSLTFKGAATITGPILIENAPTVTFDGAFSLSGSLVVYGGSLTLNGAASQSGAGPAGMSVAVIGSGDNITFNGAASLEGIFYDPEGTINLNGAASVQGAVIANRIDTINGAATITYDASYLTGVPVQSVQLVQ